MTTSDQRSFTGEKPGLLENLFLRTLKRWENGLITQNPTWTRSRGSQEARKILTAVYQNILKEELFPIILGSKNSETFNGIDYGMFSSTDFPVQEIIFAKAIGLATRYKDADDDIQIPLKTCIDFGVFDDEDIRQIEEIINFGKYLGLKHSGSCKIQYISNFLNNTCDPLVESYLEQPVEDSIFGETQASMLTSILKRAISGGMFWYDHDHNKDMFTAEQWENIVSVKLSSIICEDEGQGFLVQPSVFLIPDNTLNVETPCADLKKIDLSLWDYDDDLEDIIDNEAIEHIIDTASEKLEKLRRSEYDLYKERLSESGNSNLRASAAIGRPTDTAALLANTSALYEFVTYEVLNSKQFNIIAERKKRQINTFDIVYETRKSIFRNKKILKKVKKRLGTEKKEYKKKTKKELDLRTYEFCTNIDSTSPCDHTAKYRTYNGRCNNLENPEFGVSNSLLRRLLPAEYNDGISEPRIKGRLGHLLPSPRQVSQTIHSEEFHTEAHYTLMVMQWGQFIDHDLSHMPQYRGFNKSVLPCRSCDAGNIHPACFPISIPKDDPFYRQPGAPKCIPFTRSIGGQQHLGPREQLNQLTAYMDASMVYGHDQCQNRKVREERSYLLKSLNRNQGRSGMKSLLPLTRDNHECMSSSGECFLAGDERVNEQPGLTAMHTILMREHNHIARELAIINQHWSNETVYQETRRIIIAMVQHITYKEFLPRVLGSQSMNRFSLNLKKFGYSSDYNSKCSAGILTEFSSAAYRFGHSMIKPELVLMSQEEMHGELKGKKRKLSLRYHFNNPDFIMENSVDDILRGLLMSPMGEVDTKFTAEIRNHLFEEKDKKFSGMDLISLNIQRAREHGIPGYNSYREVCRLSRAKTFEDFLSEIGRETVEKMSQVYDHPDDVDLFTGLMSETRIPGALVGPTLACLLGHQFSNLKLCDRFWYETSDPAIRFTEEQLMQIRKVTLSRLVCRNVDHMGQVPRTGFDLHSRIRNPLTSCEDTRQNINLKYWRESVDGSCEVTLLCYCLLLRLFSFPGIRSCDTKRWCIQDQSLHSLCLFS